MVANNFFGRSNKTETTSIRLSAASSSISNLVSEKIATSAPEIKAEKTNKKKKCLQYRRVSKSRYLRYSVPFISLFVLPFSLSFVCVPRTLFLNVASKMGKSKSEIQ